MNHFLNLATTSLAKLASNMFLLHRLGNCLKNGEKRRENMQKSLKGERISNVYSPGVIPLDGMFFPAVAEEDNPLAKKAIVFAPGAAGYYED